MKKKLLSVSVAAYNVGEYLNNTIASLLVNEKVAEQIEIIIVNDGSKDDTYAIANEWQLKYPDSVVVIDKKNGGYGSTINESLKIAKGKYYKLLDGDDWYKGDNLADYLNYLGSADADIVVTPYYEVRKNKTINDGHKDILPRTELIENIKMQNPDFTMHEITVKTDALKKEDKSIEERCFYTDVEYVFYCFVGANTISRYEKPIYCYRLGVEGQSVSLVGLRKHYKDLTKVSERIYSCYEEKKRLVSGTTNDILMQLIRKITYNTYSAYMLLNNPELHKEEIINYDKCLKMNHTDIYKISNQSKLLRFCRYTRFLFYRQACAYAMRKYLREVG